VARLTVPAGYHPGLAKLMILDSEVAERLFSAAEAAPLVLNHYRLIEMITLKVDDIPEADLEEIVQVLIGLRETMRVNHISPGVFAGDICEAMAEARIPEMNPADWETGVSEKRLERFLGIKSFGVCSEATNELRDNERMFSGAKVITDIRPVFGPTLGADPVAILLVHTLKIQYRDSTERLAEIRVAMDCGDLLALRQTLDRALAKVQSLEPVLDRTNIPFLQID
jgi:hypothetical protein